jgi:hypothetical protein
MLDTLNLFKICTTPAATAALKLSEPRRYTVQLAKGYGAVIPRMITTNGNLFDVARHTIYSLKQRYINDPDKEAVDALMYQIEDSILPVGVFSDARLLASAMAERWVPFNFGDVRWALERSYVPPGEAAVLASLPRPYTDFPSDPPAMYGPGGFGDVFSLMLRDAVRLDLATGMVVLSRAP